MISLGAVSAADDANGADDGSDVISVSQDEADQLISEGSQTYNKTIYVDSHGDDSGAGSQQSPYASLNKAISSVDASDKALINIGAGIYTGDNNTDLSINLAHKNYNGSLTFIGAGKDKTIIDANKEGQIFKFISADSIVILKDIGFINAKAPNYGSAIVSEGDLTIDNCLFENNTANSYATVYQDEPNNFKVINSVFRDNTAGSGNANIYYSTYQDTDCVVEIINNTFVNATTTYSWADSSCVYVQASHILVQGNTFVNISGTGKGNLNVRADDCNVTDNVFKDCSYDGSNDGGILYIGDAYIKGNTFENWTSTKGAAIYALLNYNAYLAYDDKLVEEATFKLTCNVTDDMGNPVNTYGDVIFYLNGEKLGSAKANKGVATLNVNKLLDNGTYELSGTYMYVSFGDGSNPFNCTVKNATVTVDFDHNPMDVWVSADGNDTYGDGSEDNPFQTIKAAIDYAIDEDSVDFTIHLKDGLYNISGDYGLSYSDVIRFSIVGENYGKAIISANNAANTFLTSGQYTDVFLENLTFVNSTASRAFNVRYLNMEACIADNVGQLYAQTSPSRVVLRNVTWSHSKNFQMYNGEIYDSRFENITTSGTGVFWLATVSSGDRIIIMNSKFINIENTGNSGAVAYVQGDFVSINNTYISNKASKADYGVLYVSADYAISVNDTFIDNSAADDYGAAFFIGRNPDSFIAIKNAKFINNTAGANGGALGTNGAVLINCTFENNTAGKDGGAIYAVSHSSSYTYLDNLTLTDVTFKDNAADGNGQDIFIVPPTSASYKSANLAGMTVSFNDLSTTTLQDFVSANVTHTSGAVIGGGTITFYLNNSYMGVAEVIDGVATLDYLGFKKNGTFTLSGEYNLATNDTVYNNGTVVVALAPLKDNVTLYVSDSKGNDTTGNGSLENPYKTIKAALTSGYKQSAVIVVRVLEGTYTGELNNNLTVASSLDISIVGDGQDKTLIDGQDLSWFLNILAGDGMIKVANMTIANVTKNYVDAKLYNQHPAISIEKGATVYIDNVGFIRCHGTEGGAIYTEGTLGVRNSYFFNNGDSNNGAAIKSTGTLLIYDSKFVANHAKYYSTIYNDGNMYLANSIIEDAMRVNGWTGNAMVMGGKGNITMVNSTISRSGKTCAELIGAGQTWANNPGFAISIGSTGNVKVIDSVIDGHDKAYSAQYITNVAFGGTGSIGVFVPYGLEVVNTKILNLKDLISGSKGTNLFDTCYIENVTYATEGTSYDFNLTVVNSCFADGTTMVTKRATANVVLDNNWWGSNDQPTYKVSNVNTNPNTWLILTLNVTDDEEVLKDTTLAFKVTDGENITDYDNSLYPRDYVIRTVVNAKENSVEGVIDNKVSEVATGIDKPGYYVEATVDNQVLAVGIGKAKIEAEDVELNVGENQFSVSVLVNDAPVSNFKINVTVNKKSYEADVIDGIATFTIDELPYGNYTLEYVIEDNNICSYANASANLTVIRFDPEIAFASNVTDELIIILKDYEGTPVAGEKIEYSVDGTNGTGITDDNGQIIVPDVRGTVDVIATFKGNDVLAPISVEEEVVIFNGRKQTLISIVSVDGNLIVVGVLTDVDGNPISNATILYSYGNFADEVLTDEYGTFTVLGDNDEIEFVFAETYDYLTSNAILSLIDIAPVRQDTEIEIALGDIKINEDVNVTITVSENVTGEIEVYVDDEDAVIVPVFDGKANYTIKAVTAGEHMIFVAYLGDITHEASVASEEFDVDKLASEITINVTGAKVGETATVSVNVTEGATGVVLVVVGEDIYVIELSEGNTAELTFDEAGNYTVAANYLGDYEYDAAESDEAILVITEKADANIKIEIPTDANVGDKISINVTADTDADLRVIINDVDQTLKNGVVNYTIDKATLYTVVVIANETADYKEDVEVALFEVDKTNATIEIKLPENITISEDMEIGVETNSDGKVVVLIDGVEYEVVDGKVTIFNLEGDHSIVAYVDETDAYAGAKAFETYIVDKKDSTVEITGNNAYVDEKVTFNITVSQGATGYVIVCVDNEDFYAVEFMHNNTAALELVFDEAGNHTVYAFYEGNIEFNPATSEDITIVVSEKEAVETNITLPSDVKAGETTKVTVSIPGATGNVSVFVDGVEAIRPLDENGTATYDIPVAEAGDHSVIVLYPGDDAHDAAIASAIFTVTKEASEANITTPADFKIGEPANVTVSIPGATGYVSVIVDGNETITTLDEKGTATVTIAEVTPGEHGIVVVYAGDDIHAPVVETATFYAELFASEFRNVTVDGKGLISGCLVVMDAPIANTTITYKINGTEVNTTTDKDGMFSFYAVLPATVEFFYAGTDAILPADVEITFKGMAQVVFDSEFTNITVSGEGLISAYLVSMGAPVANAAVIYKINGTEVNTTTDKDGMFSFNASFPATVELFYAGTDVILPADTLITFKDLVPVRTATEIKSEPYTTYAIDVYAGEKGGYFKVQLVDGNGNALANKSVKIGFNGVVYDKVTDSNGWAQLQINLAKEGEYTFAIAFLGDKDYNASFVVQKIIVNKKKTSISASAKSYKASAKTKSYTVTLKTDKGSSSDGKVYLNSGKKITLTLNGKTYTAKTNSKGQATFKLSITKKGKFTTSIKFEGDNTYAASSKSVKITIN